MAKWIPLLLHLVLAMWFTLIFLRAYRPIAYVFLVLRLTGSLSFLMLGMGMIGWIGWYFQLSLLPEMEKSPAYYLGYAYAILTGV